MKAKYPISNFKFQRSVNACVVFFMIPLLLSASRRNATPGDFSAIAEAATAEAPTRPPWRGQAQTGLDAGIARIREGNFAASAALLEEAARKQPDNASAHCNLGIAYWKLKQPERAVAALEKAAELAPDDPRPLEFLGRIFSESRHWTAARDALSRARRHAPRSPRALTSSAVVEIRSGDFKQGELFLAQALELDAKYPPALYNMAVLYRNRLENERGNEERPTAPAAEHNRLKAVEYFRKYIASAGNDSHLDVASAEAARLMPHAASAGRPDAHGKTESSANMLLAAARAAMEKQAFDEALIALQQAVKSDPANREALWQLAMLYDKRLHNKDGAEQTYRKFRDMFPDDPRSGQIAEGGGRKTENGKQRTEDGKADAIRAWTQGVDCHNAKDWDRAVACYKKTLQLDPRFFNASFNLGLAYKAKGEPALAKDAFAYTVSIQPDMAKANYMLGVMYKELNDNSKAITQLEKTVKIDPSYARAHFLLGIMYRDEQLVESAKRHFQRYVELAPDQPAAARLREWLRGQ